MVQKYNLFFNKTVFLMLFSCFFNCLNARKHRVHKKITILTTRSINKYVFMYKIKDFNFKFIGFANYNCIKTIHKYIKM